MVPPMLPSHVSWFGSSTALAVTPGLGSVARAAGDPLEFHAWHGATHAMSIKFACSARCLFVVTWSESSLLARVCGPHAPAVLDLSHDGGQRRRQARTPRRRNI